MIKFVYEMTSNENLTGLQYFFASSVTLNFIALPAENTLEGNTVLPEI